MDDHHRFKPARRWFRPFIEEPVILSDLDIKQLSSPRWTTVFLLILSLWGLGVSIYESVIFRLPTAFASVSLYSVTSLWLCTFRPRTASVVVVALNLAVIACHVVSVAIYSTGIETALTAWDGLATIPALFSVVMVLNMPLRNSALSRVDISPPFSTPSKELRSPEDNLTLWQWMSVTWMASLIRIGSKRQLHDEDVWFLGYEFQHTHLHEAFRHVTGTVVWRLIKANWIDLLLLTFLALIELAASLAMPVILQQLLKAMEFIDVYKRPAIVWTVSILALRLVNAQSGVFSLWFGRRCNERSRGEMITMLHEKVLNRKIIGAQPESASNSADVQPEHVNVPEHDHLNDNDDDHEEIDESQGLLASKRKPQNRLRRIFKRLSVIFGVCVRSRHPDKLPDAKQPASMGKVLNLMRNDVYETAQRFWEFQDLVKKPLGLIFSVILTWRLVGWSCVVGIAAVVLSQVMNFFLARLFIRWEKIRRQATDHKLQQISQYVESIRHLRWYGWHVTMLKSVMSARQRELNLRIVTFILDTLIKSVNVFASATFPVAVFWAYTTLAGKELRIDVTFSALQLFSILQNNLQDLPNLITVLINASVAVHRIEEFMSEPEIATNTTSDSVDQLQLDDATFSWPGLEEKVLHKLSLSFPLGLTLVEGPVASGKSALLQGLLGELDLKEGKLIRPNTSVAYCSQTPWLQSMSIRENILFGQQFSDTRYKKVLEACALLPDLASFKHGDLSPIGENGIGLSGGQKARVALARALYSNAKYLLLDDPISALDQQTAEWIVQKCFRGDLLKHRTTVLVTHRVDLCEGLAAQRIQMSLGRAQMCTIERLDSSTNHEMKHIEGLPQTMREEQESAAVPKKFEDEEHRAHGGVQFPVYWEYVKAGKLKWWFCVILATVIWRASFYGQSWFLKEWGEAYKTADKIFVLLAQSVEKVPTTTRQPSPISRLFDKLPDPGTNVIPWLQILFVFAMLQWALFIITDIFMVVVTYNSGKNMFRDIMKSISNATFRFYDVTPVGRLMNRITGDVGTVDGAISRQFLNASWQIVNWAAAIIVIASVTPLFLVFSLALTATFVYFFMQFLPTSQSLRRLEMVSLSPLMSNFGALLHGLMTVRAFKAQSQFQSRVIMVTDAFQKMDHFYWSLQTWLMYRFDILSAFSTFALTLIAIYSGLSPGLTAIVLIAASKFVYATHNVCKQYGQLQLEFVSIERVVELLRLEQEPAGSIDPPASWPNPNGDIVFENVTVRYAPHLPPALQDITMTIPGGSSTAITGRTGSGKSTLALTMLATIAPEQGRILVDNIDISKVSKQALRERVTFLAQEPTLFPGTLRTNLDPLSQYSDTECLAVLESIGGSRFNWTLTTSVDVGGKNLSQGQRQLVGLARALLRRSSIIIMDEATASIDLETSREVQRVLRSELVNSTVISIAHRSSVVEGCDMVIRLAEGKLMDLGKPGDVDEAD